MKGSINIEGSHPSSEGPVQIPRSRTGSPRGLHISPCIWSLAPISIAQRAVVWSCQFPAPAAHSPSGHVPCCSPQSGAPKNLPSVLGDKEQRGP